MKYVKLFGLAAMATAGLMAFTTSMASATTLLSGTKILPAGTTIEASLSGIILRDTSGNPLDTCASGTVSGRTEQESAATLSVGLKFPSLSLCSNTTDALIGGTLTVSYTIGLNGSVVADGSQMTVGGIFGTSCIYGTSALGATFGTLVGSTTGNATLSAKAVTEEKEPKKLLCPDTAVWEANYAVTSPSPLLVAN